MYTRAEHHSGFLRLSFLKAQQRPKCQFHSRCSGAPKKGGVVPISPQFKVSGGVPPGSLLDPARYLVPGISGPPPPTFGGWFPVSPDLLSRASGIGSPLGSRLGSHRAGLKFCLAHGPLGRS